MPLGEPHRRQRTKNWLALGLLALLVGVLYYLTIVKIKGA